MAAVWKKRASEDADKDRKERFWHRVKKKLV